jgi:biopolymer transport protein ExbD
MSGSKPLSRFHQPIAVPGRRLMHSVRLKFVRNKAAGGGGGKALNADIPLVPFIDFLLCIVLFLLASFSSSGELPLDKNIKLPNAANAVDMIEAPMVAVTGTQILVDGIPAGSTRAIMDANRMQKVDELAEILKNKRELWKQLKPGVTFPGNVILQVDRRVPALVVKSVFQTAAFAGYPAVSFMVGKLQTGE